MPTKGVLAATALFLIFLSLAGSAWASQPVPPRLLVVQVSDFPEPFVAGGHYNTNASVARDYHLSAGDLARKGRITSYESDSDLRDRPWRVSVISEVTSYRSTAGARWEYAFRLALARAYFRDTNVRFPASLHILGNERLAFGVTKHLHTGSVGTIDGHVKRPTLVTTDIIFQRGTYVAQLAVSDLTGRYGVRMILHLAGIVDRRIQAAAVGQHQPDR